MAATTTAAAAAAAAAAALELPLKDRVAIVTGSTRGISRAIALHLASLGAKVVRSNSSSPGSAVSVRADVSDLDQVKSLFDAAEETFKPPIYVLVNSAAVLDSKYPTIANTSVDDFDKTFRPNLLAYTASKVAVETMVKILAKELKGTCITANCVVPGPIATEIFFTGKTEEMINKAIDRNVAPLVGFLATDAAEWVNGQVIRVNGGGYM
ncbi:hypothetical protein ACJRO7_007277 [Eucalyptus globulus]|uniref:Uncharacterized protein n=1 Tax=Eucalyptus globulus TaxID=34317 RepID=A0ABD3IM58_EUCGL